MQVCWSSSALYRLPADESEPSGLPDESPKEAAERRAGEEAATKPSAKVIVWCEIVVSWHICRQWAGMPG